MGWGTSRPTGVTALKDLTRLAHGQVHPTDMRAAGTAVGSSKGSPPQIRPRPSDEGLSAHQVLFLDWLCGGAPEGQSQREFAKEIGERQEVLSKWKRLPSFQVAWQSRMLDTHAHPDHLSRQLGILRDIAEHGTFVGDRLKAIDQYWKLCAQLSPSGRLVPKEAEVLRTADLLSDDELAAELAAAAPQAAAGAPQAAAAVPQASSAGNVVPFRQRAG